VKRRLTPKMKTKPIEQQMVNALLLGGPLNSRRLMVPVGTSMLNIGPAIAPFLKYSFAAREGRDLVLAKHPRGRAEMRALIRFAEKNSHDMRLMLYPMKQQPFRHTAGTQEVRWGKKTS